MLNLSDVSTGSFCQVVWLIGAIGTLLQKEFLFEPEDTLHMVRNMGKSGVIVSRYGKRYAMDASSARMVKVEALSTAAG